MGEDRVARRRTISAITAAAVAATALVVAPFAAAAAGQDDGFVVPDDEWFGQQWYLFNFGQQIGGGPTGTAGVDIRAPEAWSITRGDPDVVVAVIDSGIDLDHPDLEASMWTNPGESGGGRERNGVDDDGNGHVDDVHGWDFAEADNVPDDVATRGQSGQLSVYHGTSLASIVAARGDDGVGVTGIAPETRVMPLRAEFVADQLTDAIRYAAANGADIVSMSFGNVVPGFEAVYGGLHDEMLRHPELLYVAAAMNSGVDQDTFGTKPCTYDDVVALLCVAATDQDDRLAEFYGGRSGIGPTTVDLAAPGDNMVVAQPPRETIWAEDFGGGAADRWTVDGAAIWSTGGGALRNDGVGPVDVGTRSSIRLRDPVAVTDRHECRIEGSITAPDGFVGVIPQVDLGRGPTLLARGLSTELASAVRSGERQRFDVPLGALDRTGPTQALSFGFTYNDISGERERPPVSIDDLALTCAGDAYTGRDYAYVEGTSYATPLTAGVAALVWAAHPELSAVEVRQAVLDGVRPVAALRGKVASGGRLDAYGALLAARGERPAHSSREAASDRSGPSAGGAGGAIAGLGLPPQGQPAVAVPPTRPGAGDGTTGPHDAAAVGADGAAVAAVPVDPAGGGSSPLPWAAAVAATLAALAAAGWWFLKRPARLQLAGVDSGTALGEPQLEVDPSVGDPPLQGHITYDQPIGESDAPGEPQLEADPNVDDEPLQGHITYDHPIDGEVDGEGADVALDPGAGADAGGTEESPVALDGEVKVGAWTDGEAFVGWTDGDFASNAHGEAEIGVEVTGAISGDVGVVGLSGEGSAFAGGSLTGDAGLEIGDDGFEAEVAAEAFLGVKAEASATASFGDWVEVTGVVEGSVGVGAGAEAEAEMTWEEVSIELDAGVTAGVGGGAGIEIKLKPQQIIDDIGNGLQQLGDQLLP